MRGQLIDQLYLHVHVRVDGQVIEGEESDYIWIDQSIIGNSYHHVPNDDLIPSIITPLSTAPLSHLLSLMHTVMKQLYSSATYLSRWHHVSMLHNGACGRCLRKI